MGSLRMVPLTWARFLTLHPFGCILAPPLLPATGVLVTTLHVGRLIGICNSGIYIYLFCGATVCTMARCLMVACSMLLIILVLAVL